MDKFKLTLEGEGLSLDREIDSITALAVMNIVMGRKESSAPASLVEQGAPPTAIPSVVEGAGPPKAETHQYDMQDKPISLREFVIRLQPKTNAQRILSIAQFLSEHQGLSRFKRDDIKPKFPSIGEPLPKNYSRDFQTALDKGWIAEDHGEKGSFYVTRTGETQIQHGFSGRRN